jgi:hypothetical protein
MDFIWYLIVGIIGFIFGFVLAVKVTHRKKAGLLRMIKDEDEDVYYLHADLDLEPFELMKEAQVIFDIQKPPVAETHIARTRK